MWPRGQLGRSSHGVHLLRASACVSFCALPRPAPSRSIKYVTAQAAQELLAQRGKGRSRAALPLRHLKAWTTRNTKGNEEEKEEEEVETVVTANASSQRGLQHAHALRVIVLAGDF